MIKTTQWKIAGKSVVGTSHEKSGKECEDSWYKREIDDLLCLCVSDGAGSKPHGREGAICVTRSLTDWLPKNFESLFYSDGEDVKKKTCQKLQNAIRCKAKKFKHEYNDYACTVVAAILHRDGRWVALHLGDGGIVGLFEKGLCIISTPMKGEYANETFFITNHFSEQYMIVIRGDSSGENGQLRGVALFSDGVEGSLINRHQNTVAPVVEKIIKWLRNNSSQKTQQALKKNLEDVFRKKSSDDCTLVVGLCHSPLQGDEMTLTT